MALLKWILLSGLWIAFEAGGADFQCEKLDRNPVALKGISRDGRSLKPVFVYFANDMAVNPGADGPYQNLLGLVAKIRRALDSSLPAPDKKYLNAAADILTQEFLSFTRETDRQIDELEKFGCGSDNNFKTGLVIVSNHGTRTPVYDASTRTYSVKLNLTYCRPNQSDSGFNSGQTQISWSYSAVKLPKTDEDLLASQMLMNPLFIDHTFREILRLFPSDRFNYFIWVRSFGDSQHLMRPYLYLDFEKIEAESIWQTLLGTKIAGLETATPKEIEASRSEWSLSLRKSLEEAFEPSKFQSEFIAKMTFLDIASKFNSVNKNMLYPFLVWDTDQSSPSAEANGSFSEILSKPGGLENLGLDSVGRLCSHPNSGEQWRHFSFSKLFLPLGVSTKETPFQTHFAHVLKAKID